jgi:cysteinyl-tRNA synthetase
MSLVIYNTLTRRKEEFVPLRKNAVGIYVCGPTVYGHSHLGHAKSYVSFDVIVRYLRSTGYSVLYVQNITDVGHLSDDADEGEDKIEKQSRIDRVHPMQLAEEYTRSYFEDMDAIGNLRPDICPRASGHILEQIQIVQQLFRKGFAYEANGSVYFDVSKFAGYGKLSRRSVDEMIAGVRVGVKAEKKHPADFALWKKAEPGHIMRWPSPWGEGFPGWHVECSAMSMKYLGESFDIHGGGLENQFPHHECEIAQSEAATGHPFAKYWLHNNMVTVDGRKMGKSLGNSISLKDAYAKWPAPVIRFFILQSHYRSPLDFSNAALEGAARGMEKLVSARQALQERIEASGEEGVPAAIDVDRYRAQFTAAMDDDFNTPQALAVLFDFTREVNQVLSGDQKVPAASLRRLEQVYGDLGEKTLGLSFRMRTGEEASAPSLEHRLMDLLISIRRDLRTQKLWDLSDRIRDGLTAIGIALEDRKEGTTWKRNP